MKRASYHYPGSCLLLARDVKRRRFPVGASLARQPLQPEATGATDSVIPVPYQIDFAM